MELSCGALQACRVQASIGSRTAQDTIVLTTVNEGREGEAAWLMGDGVAPWGFGVLRCVFEMFQTELVSFGSGEPWSIRT